MSHSTGRGIPSPSDNLLFQFGSIMNRVLHRIATVLPGGFVRFLGRAQFSIPMLAPAIRRLGRLATDGEGVIGSGVGRGLRFDATGGLPGYLLGTSDPAEQQVLARTLKEGDVFYDIGANIGFYTTIAGRLVGETGRVIAFEPFPASARRCERNAALNSFQHVRVEQAAVSKESGELQLALSDAAVNHKLASPSLEGRAIAVPVWSIDDFIDASGERIPNVVMIDVEGAEIDVLRGMQQTIRSARPTILCEVHWLGTAFEEYINDAILPHGYVAHTYTGGPLPKSICRYQVILKPGE